MIIQSFKKKLNLNYKQTTENKHKRKKKEEKKAINTATSFLC